ncbi:metal-dependent hydrolase [Acinetobacter baumannii]|nr:metal-dependent hydrolase [Acinetobacter baumannii]OLV30906.1 metal-dependent hydrolase [Acinetobacter baumannii]OLV35868.1 metal-dependent hydrolase [Acinetobacter baumannii]OLV36031.1 metal-dependent hydrolase [Acinetobacter baumannii]OLV44272.1 metal-dependent hydrolase [Acinetobacter baumannii]
MKLLSFLKNKALGSSIDYKILPRKVKFDWKDTPEDWIPNQPFASYFINEINNILPAGEFWFCRLYNKVLPRITDEKLKQDVQAFIRQEAMHANAHTSANKEYLSARNIDIQRNLDIMNYLFTTALADKPFDKEVPQFLQEQWDLFRLGVIATVEHMTCVLGKYALYNKRWEELGADPEMVDLVKWHGSEEIEHRTVAFDLYRHLGGGYMPRYYLSLAVIVLVLGLWVDGAAHIMKQDPRFADAAKSRFFPAWVALEWYKISRKDNQVLPNPIWLIAQQIDYLMPWYDPVKEGSTEDAVSYLSQSPAAKRAELQAA